MAETFPASSSASLWTPQASDPQSTAMQRSEREPPLFAVESQAMTANCSRRGPTRGDFPSARRLSSIAGPWRQRSLRVRLGARAEPGVARSARRVAHLPVVSGGTKKEESAATPSQHAPDQPATRHRVGRVASVTGAIRV